MVRNPYPNLQELDVVIYLTEWALPDQLVFATVSALLRIASIREDQRAVATNAIAKFAEQIVYMLKTGEGASSSSILVDTMS